MSREERVRTLLTAVDEMSDLPAPEDVRVADSRDGSVYRLDDRMRMAVKVAFITARPLLLIGPPGCGKSSLAPYVARNLELDLLSYTVMESSEPSDVLWNIDYVKRLNDAQVHQLDKWEEYIDRGVLWKAYDPKPGGPGEQGSVVLIDEIDKADSSFANSLLVAIGSLQFEVPPLDRVVKADPSIMTLVIFTSNGERELPPAFTRRCITLSVEYPGATEMIDIARRRWPGWMSDPTFASGVESLAEHLVSGQAGATVTTAEFLDLVQVLHTSALAPDAPEWEMVESLVMLDGRSRPGGR